MARRLSRFGLLLVVMLTVASITMAVMGTVAGAAGGGGKGFGTTSTLSISPQATLVTSSPLGPGLNITLTYSCFPGFGGGKGGYGGGGFVNVTDLQGDQGFGFWSPTCNDKKQTAVVFLPGFFVAGGGAAQANFCAFECAGDSREIKIS